MRVGLIAPPWVPVPGPGYGLEVTVDHLARGLDAAGHEVMLYASADSTCSVPRAPGTMESVGLPGLGLQYELAHVIEGYRTLRQWEPDVIHDHTVTGALYADEIDCPVVVTHHNPFSAHYCRYFETISKRVALVAISQHHARTAGGCDVTDVIYNGTDTDTCPMGDGSGGYALFLGRFDAEKGAHLAIDAAHAAGVRLVLAAHAPRPIQERYFNEAIRPRLHNGAEWIGPVRGVDWHHVLSHAACLVFPIQWEEPFGLVMIEALAHGTPIVAISRGSVPEIVNHGVTGYTVHDPHGLAEGIRRCVAGQISRHACREDAERRFSTHRMAHNYTRLYERLRWGHHL